MGRELFDRIIKWNSDRENMGFNHLNETKMLAEELFEFCGYSRQAAKDAGKEFAKKYSGDATKEINKSDLADAAGDLIFISIGTIAKLGLDPYEVLKRICDHNDAKGSKKDADGKIIKNDDFKEPEH